MRNYDAAFSLMPTLLYNQAFQSVMFLVLVKLKIFPRISTCFVAACEENRKSNHNECLNDDPHISGNCLLNGNEIAVEEHSQAELDVYAIDNNDVSDRNENDSADSEFNQSARENSTENFDDDDNLCEY